MVRYTALVVLRSGFGKVVTYWRTHRYVGDAVALGQFRRRCLAQHAVVKARTDGAIFVLLAEGAR